MSQIGLITLDLYLDETWVKSKDELLGSWYDEAGTKTQSNLLNLSK